MQLIACKQAANAKYDRLRFIRANGTQAEIDMPRQGALPHDLVHYIVEDSLQLHGGFLSLVAAGAEPRFAMEATHDPQRRDIERSAFQAEAYVEALQTQLWAGAMDVDAFAYGVQTACEARAITPPAPLPPAQAQQLFDRAQALHREWLAVAPMQALGLRFELRKA